MLQRLEPRAGTDRSLSVASAEFLWDSAEADESHRHVAGPVCERLARAKAHKVLDLGCGNGAFTDRLRRLGHEVTGLDASRSGLALARAHFPASTFDHVDLAEPLDGRWRGRFDAVVSVEVVEHLWLPRRLFVAACAALRPGGLLIVTTPYHGYLKNLAIALSGGFDRHWHPLRDHGHVKFFSRATLSQLFEEHGFEALEFTPVGRIAPLARSMVMSGRAP